MKFYFLYNLSDGTVVQFMKSSFLDDQIIGLPSDLGVYVVELSDPIAQQAYNDPTQGKWVVVNGQLINQATDEERLQFAKTKQLHTIAHDYAEAQNKTFQSSALGSPYTYLADIHSMAKYDAILARFSNDPTYTEQEIFTLEEGYVVHTKDQFTQVWTDGFQRDKDLAIKHKSLVEQINAVELSNYSSVEEAISAVQAIVWG